MIESSSLGESAPSAESEIGRAGHSASSLGAVLEGGTGARPRGSLGELSEAPGELSWDPGELSGDPGVLSRAPGALSEHARTAEGCFVQP